MTGGCRSGAAKLNAPHISEVLYPTSSGAPTNLLAVTPVFVGVPVVRNGAVAAGLHPVRV